MSTDLSDFSKYVSEVKIRPVGDGKLGTAYGENNPPTVVMYIHINWQQISHDAQTRFDPGMHQGSNVLIGTSIAKRTVEKIAADLTSATGVKFEVDDIQRGDITAKLSTVEFTDVMPIITSAITTQQRHEEAGHQIAR